MNYIILNDDEFFRDKINLKGFKEVDLFGEERADAVFCHFSKKLLAYVDNYTDNGRVTGDSVFPGSELLRDAGIFVVSKIDRDILYDEDTELIEKVFRFFDQESFYIEVRGYNRAETYNQIDQFIIAYRKNLGYIEDLLPNNIENDIFETILKSIEEKLL